MTTIQTATFNGAYSSSNFAKIAYGVSMPNQSYVAAISAYVSWVYFIDDGLSNPYDTLPTYFTLEVCMLSNDVTPTTC